MQQLNSTGKEVTWVWDSKQEKPVLKGKKRQPTIEYNMEKEGIGSTLKFLEDSTQSHIEKLLMGIFIKNSSLWRKRKKEVDQRSTRRNT